jgi:pimeloyl-ACP methyl ester carboxylesterase
MSQLLPFIELGDKKKPLIVFLAGFPDNQLSGWGDVIIQDLMASNRLIFLCLPGYEKGATKYKPWGFGFETLVEMMHNTLISLAANMEPFNLVGHDWGAFLSILYENKYPQSIRKLVLLDVGLLKPENAPIKHILIILLYQFWFAIAYILSQTISVTLGDALFKLFFLKPVVNTVGPCPGELLTIPTKDFTVHKCYPYYHFWRSQFLMYFKEPVYPSCPLLYMVSIFLTLFIVFLSSIAAYNAVSLFAVWHSQELHVPRPELLAASGFQSRQ